VHAGALAVLKPAVDELAAFVEANVPPLIAYNVYLNDERTRMTVIHVHRDSASLEYHLNVGGPAFRKLADLITLSSIDVFGAPSPVALDLLNDKARLLGGEAANVVVHEWQAGFARFEAR
jgi:hypothetical protein